MVPITTIEELCRRYSVLLFDAFGVLVDGGGALPGADRLIEMLKKTGKRFFIVSNGSKFTPAETAVSYQKKGLGISAEQIITSGGLLDKWVSSNALAGRTVKVVGPQESFELIRWAGAIPIAPDSRAPYEALILCNQDGFDFLPTLDLLVSELSHLARCGKLPRLVLPNPDIVYPNGSDLGFTIGVVAAMIELALQPLFPDLIIQFERLGKPFSPIFDEAIARAGCPKAEIVMIGDQIATDIKGAITAGLDSVMVSYGLTDPARLPACQAQPTWILNSLD